MKIFKDRKSAGQLLAKKLKNVNADLVLGIPRGGVVVASEIAKELNLPLDIIVTRKIGAPMQPELALGALDPDGQVLWEEKLLQEVEINKEELANIIKNEWKELKRREDLYRQRPANLKVEGKRIILVDDGIATGATILSAINYLKRRKATVILAVPVSSKETFESVSREISQAEVLHIPDNFHAVGQFYHDFPQVTDEEVVQLVTN